MGAKLMMLFTPARTRVSAASWAAWPGTVSTAIWMPRSRTSDSMSDDVDAAHPVDQRVGERGVDVERRHDGHGRALVGEVGEHRVPEVADADQRDLLLQRPVEEVADALDARGDVVALVGAAGVADDHEVAAHLGRADHGVSRELVRVDALDAALVEGLSSRR